MFGGCWGAEQPPNNPLWVGGAPELPRVCPRAAPGVPQPTPQTVLLLIINILPPQRGEAS